MSELYLGDTAEGLRVWAHIEIEAGSDRVATFTDHSEGPTPERLSISFTLLKQTLAAPAFALDRYWESTGQVPTEEWAIAKVATGITRAQIDMIDAAWKSSHLNDMNAACDHIDETRRAGESISDYQTRMLNTPDGTCPETGYQWGHAWLARKVPTETLAAMRELARLTREE